MAACPERERKLPLGVGRRKSMAIRPRRLYAEVRCKFGTDKIKLYTTRIRSEYEGGWFYDLAKRYEGKRDMEDAPLNYPEYSRVMDLEPLPAGFEANPKGRKEEAVSLILRQAQAAAAKYPQNQVVQNQGALVKHKVEVDQQRESPNVEGLVRISTYNPPSEIGLQTLQDIECAPYPNEGDMKRMIYDRIMKEMTDCLGTASPETGRRRMDQEDIIPKIFEDNSDERMQESWEPWRSACDMKSSQDCRRSLPLVSDRVTVLERKLFNLSSRSSLKCRLLCGPQQYAQVFPNT